MAQAVKPKPLPVEFVPSTATLTTFPRAGPTFEVRNCTGRELFADIALPSTPSTLLPQHHTEASVFTAQVGELQPLEKDVAMNGVLAAVIASVPPVHIVPSVRWSVCPLHAVRQVQSTDAQCSGELHEGP